MCPTGSNFGGVPPYASTNSAAHPALISEDMRMIRIAGHETVLGCVGDKGVRRVWFVAPRYCDGTDMAEFEFEICSVNADGEEDLYFVTEVEVHSKTLVFSWRPSVTDLSVQGPLKASVRARGSNRLFQTRWATWQVHETLDTSPAGFHLITDTGSRLVTNRGTRLVAHIAEGSNE